MSVFELADVGLEEVAFEHVADAKQQGGVDARAAEDFVDVGPVAV